MARIITQEEAQRLAPALRLPPPPAQVEYQVLPPWLLIRTLPLDRPLQGSHNPVWLAMRKNMGIVTASTLALNLIALWKNPKYTLQKMANHQALDEWELKGVQELARALLDLPAEFSTTHSTFRGTLLEETVRQKTQHLLRTRYPQRFPPQTAMDPQQMQNASVIYRCGAESHLGFSDDGFLLHFPAPPATPTIGQVFEFKTKIRPSGIDLKYLVQVGYQGFITGAPVMLVYYYLTQDDYIITNRLFFDAVREGRISLGAYPTEAELAAQWAKLDNGRMGGQLVVCDLQPTDEYFATLCQISAGLARLTVRFRAQADQWLASYGWTRQDPDLWAKLQAKQQQMNWSWLTDRPPAPSPSGGVNWAELLLALTHQAHWADYAAQTLVDAQQQQLHLHLPHWGPHPATLPNVVEALERIARHVAAHCTQSYPSEDMYDKTDFTRYEDFTAESHKLFPRPSGP